MSNLILTKDKDEDYSNCSQWDQKGKCLSCREGEVEYQGSCFDRLEGCLIQPGDICVRCSSNYVQFGYKCYRGCSSFFDWFMNMIYQWFPVNAKVDRCYEYLQILWIRKEFWCATGIKSMRLICPWLALITIFAWIGTVRMLTRCCVRRAGRITAITPSIFWVLRIYAFWLIVCWKCPSARLAASWTRLWRWCKSCKWFGK